MDKSEAVAEAVVTHSSSGGGGVTTLQENNDNDPFMLRAVMRVVENIYAADGHDGIQKLLDMLPLPLPFPRPEDEEDRGQEEEDSPLLRDVMPGNHVRPHQPIIKWTNEDRKRGRFGNRSRTCRQEEAIEVARSFTDSH